MLRTSTTHRGLPVLVTAAALVVIIYGLNQAQSVASIFLMSVFLALIGTPPVLWMEKKRVPSFLAVMIVMFTMVAMLLVIGTVVGESLSSFSDAWPTYQKKLQEGILSLKPILAEKHIIVTNKVLLGYFNPGPVMDIAVGLLAGVGVALSNILLVFLTVTFILLEASNFPVKLRAVLGNPNQDFPQFTKFVNDIERYMVIKTIVSLATGGLIGVWLYALGIESPILWAFLAFLLNYVPSVGSSIAAIPPVLLAFVQFGFGSAMMVVGGYMAVNFILDNIIETKLMGRKLGLSTLVVFLSLLFWGSVLGPIGMVLCIPFTMTLKFACENNEETRWIAVFLSSEDDHPVAAKNGKAKKKPEAENEL
ncbi:MAG: AI-2E family transporter [Bacteroidota bacterium]